MKTYRITKYDPRKRDASGAYTGSEWTAYSDVGHRFDGRLVTESGYLRVETAYVTTALSLLRAGGIRTLTVTGLEDARGRSDVQDGQALDLTDLATVFRRVLREEFWCRFEGANAYVHFGWDYYMYVGVPDDIGRAPVAAGLYVEEMESPYAKRDNVRIGSPGLTGKGQPRLPHHLACGSAPGGSEQSSPTAEAVRSDTGFRPVVKSNP